jgi:heptosyltransferase-3
MKILFITATRIGDAVLSTGLLSHLVAQYPNARVTIAAGPAAAALFKSMPGLERLIVMQKKRGSLHWFDLWRQCIGHRWDLVVDLRRSAISWLLFARARRIAPPTNLNRHRVEHLAATFSLQDNPPAPVCWTSQESEDRAAALLPEGAPAIAIAAAANWPGKQWRAEYFVALADRLTGPDGILPNARIVALATTQERDQVQPLLAEIPEARLIDLVGQTDLPVAAAILRRCDFFVGNDSGLMHISAAVGTPTLGLFGPSHTTHYAPWGDRTGWVRTAQTYDEIVGAPDYDHRTTGTVMDSLTVDMAESAALDLWRRITKTPVPASRGEA